MKVNPILHLLLKVLTYSRNVSTIGVMEIIPTVEMSTIGVMRQNTPLCSQPFNLDFLNIMIALCSNVQVVVTIMHADYTLLS